jgi:hypothetical protein
VGRLDGDPAQVQSADEEGVGRAKNRARIEAAAHIVQHESKRALGSGYELVGAETRQGVRVIFRYKKLLVLMRMTSGAMGHK